MASKAYIKSLFNAEKESQQVKRFMQAIDDGDMDASLYAWHRVRRTMPALLRQVVEPWLNSVTRYAHNRMEAEQKPNRHSVTLSEPITVKDTHAMATKAIELSQEKLASYQALADDLARQGFKLAITGASGPNVAKVEYPFAFSSNMTADAVRLARAYASSNLDTTSAVNNAALSLVGSSRAKSAPPSILRIDVRLDSGIVTIPAKTGAKDPLYATTFLGGRGGTYIKHASGLAVALKVLVGKPS